MIFCLLLLFSSSEILESRMNLPASSPVVCERVALPEHSVVNW